MKTHAIRCEWKGIKFPSKLERDCYIYLESLQDKGIISNLKRQIKFMVVGKIKHYIDFSCVYNELVYYIEAKGKDLALGKLKRLIIEEKNEIIVRVVYSIQDLEGIFNGRSKHG